MSAELPPSPLAFLPISSKVKLGLLDNETTNVSHELGSVISKKMALRLSIKGVIPESYSCDKVLVNKDKYLAALLASSNYMPTTFHIKCT